LFISSTLFSLFPPQIVESTDEVIKIVGNGDSTKELFPLKMRDAAQAAGFAYIKSKGLIPEEDSDDYIPVSATAFGTGVRGAGGRGHQALDAGGGWHASHAGWCSGCGVCVVPSPTPCCAHQR
jgi:hypothetical protein